MSDPKCCFCIPLHLTVWIYAVFQALGLLSLVIRLEMYPEIFAAQMPRIVISSAMMVYVLLMLGVKAMDTHAGRLIFFNIYLALPVLLYNMWFAFIILNDWWISIPSVMCKDTKVNSETSHSPGFEDCVEEIKG